MKATSRRNAFIRLPSVDETLHYLRLIRYPLVSCAVPLPENAYQQLTIWE